MKFSLKRLGESVKVSRYGLLVLGVAALLLWAWSLPRIDPGRMTDLGFISVWPVSLYLAFALLLITFGLAVWRSDTPTPILILLVVALIFMLHGTPQLVYGTLRYSWAWKHVGVIDYIQRHGAVDPNIAYLDVYHNWPGFFAFNALLTQVLGVDSVLSYAGWAPVFFHLLNFGALWLIFSTLTEDRRLIWLSIWIFYLTNWIGQEYFSPQAFGYFLYLIILGVSLRWFRTVTSGGEPFSQRWRRLDRVRRLYQAALRNVAQDRLAFGGATTGQRLGLTTMVLAIFAVIASSHQLTPIMSVVAVASLVVFRRINTRLLPILMLGIGLFWFGVGAAPYVGRELASTLESVGKVADNIDGNLVNVAQLSANQRLVATVGRGLTGLAILLAGLGLYRRWRKGYWDLSTVILLGAPGVLFIGNSYGGEVLFRTYLFAVPFIAFFVAALFFPSPVQGVKPGTQWLIVGLSCVLFGGFSFAYYGKDQQYYFTPQEVEAAQYLFNTAPPNSLLVEGSRNYPTLFRNYENFVYVPIEREPRTSQAKVRADPAGVLRRWLANDRYAATYLFITRSQKAEVDTLGLMPLGALDQIEQALLHSPQFQVIYRNQDAIIFTLSQPITK